MKNKSLEKEIIKSFFKYIIVLTLIIYSMFSFVLWDLNPYNWGERIRISFITVLVLLSIIVIANVIHIKTDEFND